MVMPGILVEAPGWHGGIRQRDNEEFGRQSGRYQPV